jgi:hypothetical protein
MMEWQSEQFGPSHGGRPAAVLADGSEPQPVYFDIGSGSHGHRTSEWWVYDGTLNAPQATGLRAACSCGWRGATRYPLVWDDAVRRHPHLLDTSGPESDWDEHIADVEARSVPLPENLVGLLDRLAEELDRLAADAPLAALKAVAILERVTDSVAHRAALTAGAEVLSWDAVATALGLTPQDARARLAHYALRS